MCGLYAILNAYQLVGWPETKLTRSRLKSLVAYAARSAATPISDILGAGMSEETWVELCVSLINEANATLGLNIKSKLILQGRAGRSTAMSLRTIRKNIDKGWPVLVMLWGRYDHATVLSGYTHDRFLLFDSSGFKWISAENVGLDHGWSSKAHRLSRNSVIALTAEQT